MNNHLKHIATWTLLSGLLCICDHLSAEDWTRFRGPNGNGIAKSAAPTQWDSKTNLKWSVDLPGPGSSCPIVLDKRVYLTCYTGYGVDQRDPGDVKDLKRHLLCFDRNNGKLLWRSSVDSENDEDPYKGFITHHGYASSTPVTDGKHIFVQFGKTGLFAFDMDGKQVWKKHVGSKSDPAKWGNGASCVLYKDMVIINAGNTDKSIIAFKKDSGEEVWRVTDPKFTFTWSTPIIAKVDDHDEMILNMPGKILAYNPNTGEELWSAKSPIEKTICGSCVYDDGVVYAMGGREGRAVAVKVGGKGDVSETHTLWSNNLRSGINTPIVANGNLYWIATNLILCADCKSGEYEYRERVDGSGAGGPSGDYASPVAIGDKLLILTSTGVTHVVEATDEFKKVGDNKFSDDDSRFNATPAISDGEIFIRSNNRLYCIAEGGGDDEG